MVIPRLKCKLQKFADLIEVNQPQQQLINESAHKINFKQL